MAFGTQGTDLQQRFDHLVSSNKLWNTGDKLLLAFSGGLDSVVLFHLLHGQAVNIELAHINFGLRGAESDEDEQWCKSKSFAKAGTEQKMLTKIKIHTTKFNTKALTQKGESIQMTARRLRYEWLQQVKTENNCRYILTAHHLNDQLETVLYNFAKGTGLGGLQGMPLKRGDLLRPLLHFTRAELEQYAAEHKLEWREDASNQTVKYSRNRIRHRVVPELRNINPALEETFANTLRHLQSASQALNYFCRQWLDENLQHDWDKIWVDIALLKNHPCADALLFNWLQTYGFTETQLVNAKTATQAGKVFETNSHRLHVEQSRFLLMPFLPAQAPFEVQLEFSKSDSIQLPDGRSFSWQSRMKTAVKKNPPNIATLDAGKLNRPLTLRPWQTGDKIQVLGMKGKSKLVSDLLTDAKVPVSEKDRVLVLLSGSDIVWVVGYRISEKVKLDDKSTEAVEFRID